LSGLRVILIAVIFLLPGNAYLFAQELQEMTDQAAAAQNESFSHENGQEQKVKPVQDVFEFKETPKLRGYTYDLKGLLAVAERNIKKVDEEIKQEEVKKRNEAREAEIVGYFEKGNELYMQGNLKEAKQEWENAVRVSKNPEMKQYIEDRSREAKIQMRKEEKARKARLAAEERELNRLAKEEQARQARLEAEERELNRLAGETGWWPVYDITKYDRI